MGVGIDAGQEGEEVGFFEEVEENDVVKFGVDAEEDVLVSEPGVVEDGIGADDIDKIAAPEEMIVPEEGFAMLVVVEAPVGEYERAEAAWTGKWSREGDERQGDEEQKRERDGVSKIEEKEGGEGKECGAGGGDDEPCEVAESEFSVVAEEFEFVEDLLILGELEEGGCFGSGHGGPFSDGRFGGDGGDLSGLDGKDEGVEFSTE